MGKVKYNEEMKLQTVKYVLEGGKSATKVAKELGIDTNTVCRWVREYREAQGMPSYEAEQRIKRQTADEMAAKIKELEKEIKRKDRELADEKEKVEILKNACTSLCNHKNEMRSNLRKSGTAFREKDVRSFKDQSVPILSVDPLPR
jgi:transposase-like protein